tara:strand:- start:551 stop:1408 length:858 start_codon:yes stop_codon:yes gene_type:complete
MHKIGSLCSGVGGLDIAVESVYESKTVWFSDILEAANEVFSTHWPNATQLGDFRETEPKTVEDIDILTAGFPCQPVSISGVIQGKRKGTEDERWLFDEIIEWTSQLRLRPKKIILENVQGLLSDDDGNTFRNILRALSELGYCIRWEMVWASEAGAPHRRARVFLVASTPDSHVDRLQTVREELQLGEMRQEVEIRWGRYGEALSAWTQITGRPPPYPVLDDRTGPCPWFVEWAMGFDHGHVLDIIPNKTKALELLGNAVVWRQAKLALEIIEDSPSLGGHDVTT